MNFGSPELLWLLLLAPGVVGLWLRREQQRAAALRRLGEGALVARLLPSASRSRRLAKLALWLIAAGLVLIALARPRWGTEVSVIEAQGVSVMVALDVSNSMNAQDVLPSRLDRSKLAIRALFETLAGNEVGLILFAGSAFVQFPLTTDLASAETFLNAASSRSITRQGTAIAEALRLAVESFDDRRAGDRVIVLVSDGENHEGDPLQVADEAAQAGIIIHTVGVGGIEGEPVPVLDDAGNITTYRADPRGDVVLSALDETTLRAIAERTGGVYVRIGDGTDIATVAQQINAAEGSLLESRVQDRAVERFTLFVALALAALTVEIWLRETR